MKSKKFVEYEISCQYRVVIQKVHKEYVYQWSVWKRYSDFESLHSLLKKSLGWRIDNIEFPSSSMFIMNKLTPDFIDQRRLDNVLNRYNKFYYINLYVYMF